MKYTIILAILLSFIIISCNSSSSDPVSTTTPVGTFKVSGKITADGKPVSGATVQIGDVFNWKATTDADGKFTITNVAQGEYYFKAEKKMDNDRTIFKKSKVSLQNEVT
ncbi:MAG: carboxypeptidase-like regulatory domain-containing protein, partial [Bacteroidota bacterium]|nr:carboxypeptidase-like regulatory domain-containing protein [Bacteroidota bacterium]